MRRKTIQLAGKTLVVSLPASWCKARGIKKGQELEVSQVGTAIVVEPIRLERGHHVKADLSGLNASLVWHSIVSKYIGGAGEIEAVFGTSPVVDPRTGRRIRPADAVERVVDELIGMEIIRQGKGSATIREVSSVAPEEYPNIMRRVWLTCLSMVEEGSSALASDDGESFSAAVRVEKNVNRLVLYALRMLNRGVGCNVSSALADAHVLRCLEGFADAVASQGKAKGPDREAVASAAVLLRCSYDYWFDPSNKGADRMYCALLSLRRRRDAFPALVSAGEALVESVAPAGAIIR